AGGAMGLGMVVEFYRYNRQISEFDPERRTVRAGAGVVLDQLNAFLRPHGLHFGPDVATSSRASIGGMIANNSSGAHVPVYGVTSDHVAAVEIVLADGTLLRLSEGQTGRLGDEQTWKRGDGTVTQSPSLQVSQCFGELSGRVQRL